jgi:tetratricopeptide (TPR) repeat protein
MQPNTAGRDGDAIARFEGYLKVDPDNTLLRIDLGDLYHSVGRFADARSCYTAVLQKDPDNVVVRSRLACVAISEHRFEEAEAALRDLHEHGDDPADTHNLGLALVYQKRWVEALELFEQARAAGLNSLEPQKYITRTLHQMGDFDRAIKECKAWLEFTGSDEVEGYLALLEGDSGEDPPAAQARARSVLERSPDNVDAGVVVGTEHLEKQDLEKARTIFTRLSQRAPNNPRTWLGLGLIALIELRHDDAIRHLEKTLELLPGDAATLSVLGWVHISKMDGFAAEKAFREAIAADPKLAEAHGGLASALVHQFQFDEALRSVRRARALNKECFGAGYAMSLMAEMKGRHDTAEKIFASYLEKRPRPDAMTPMEALSIALARNAHPQPTPGLSKPLISRK